MTSTCLSINRFTCAAYYHLLQKGIDGYAEKQAHEQHNMPTRHQIRIAKQRMRRCLQVDLAQDERTLQQILRECNEQNARLSVKGVTNLHEDVDSIQEYASLADRYLYYYWDIIKVTPMALWRSIAG